MSDYDISCRLQQITGRESGVYIESDYVTVINWMVDPPCWQELPAVVDAYRVDDIRTEIPVDIHSYQDADTGWVDIEICGGTISDDAWVDLLALWGISRMGRTICVGDVEPTSGKVFTFDNGVTIITPDGWH